MARKPKAAKTGELDGMPPMDYAAQAATDWLEAKKSFDAAKVVLQDAAADVIVAFREANRESLQIQGVVVKMKHKAAEDVVQMSKPKEK